MQEEVLATVAASSPRRWTGVGMLVTVGVLVIYVALASPPQFGWQVFLLAAGAAAFWLAHRMWSATEDRIELTPSQLRTGSGQVICKVEDVEAVDRSVFAFKPSNGFLVKTHTPNSNNWAPGLWWRVGRRIGVGGMTAAAETKFMSEMLSAMLAEKD
ncbi:hypothetical protein RA27_01875 [Ruegeria sp. ANG-R]|uniref:hypothetical protein n=1 Tax=Ruegeria sp. ANG-R TaxID=1577903 RepID=UPI00057EB7AB|nr:hypothetical protein [Ruegeria sp. ANG-R]KIC42169.1 hypothetical protein RA27_01875 [Ruegeria sp. ANG-R]